VKLLRLSSRSRIYSQVKNSCRLIMMLVKRKEHKFQEIIKNYIVSLISYKAKMILI